MNLPKKISEETWPKIYLGQDPDPDLVQNHPDPQHCINLLKKSFKDTVSFRPAEKYPYRTKLLKEFLKLYLD
jgi:hypothetical protein